jgi:hypothetical protein
MESSRKNSQEKESEKVMPPNEDKKKKGGLLNDLAMGLGLKDRDASYYNRTAKTIGRTQGADAQQRYMRSSGYGRPQAGLFSFLSGGNNQNSSTGGNNIIPRMFGYRDTTDMFDRGGKYASGGMYQDGGGYSVLANIGAALSGQDMGERQLYVDQYIDQQKGAGFAEQMKTEYPDYYQQLVVNAMRNM